MKEKNIWIYRQLNYHQLRIRSEIGISLEIILNAVKCLTVSLSNEILFLAIVLLSFISVRHPVQVPQWPSNFAPRIKTKFKDFSGELQKKYIHWGHLIFHQGAKQKSCSNNAEIL